MARLTNNIVFIVVISVLLFGCEDSEKALLSKQSIVYCSEGTPEGFNPQTVTSGVTVDATSNILYDRLISFNKADNSLEPALAKSWHITRDGKKITFYLRKDVSFNSTDYFKPTRHLNADDVIFSFSRILDSSHPFHYVSGGRYPFFQSVSFEQLIDNIEKINDYTVRFTLTRADSTLLTNLATDYAVILSKEYGDNLLASGQLQDMDNKPVGTGPYYLKDYRAGSYIRYYPNKDYWRVQTELEQLIYDITASDTGRLTKLLTHECDVIAYPIAHNEINNRSDLTLDEVTAFNVGYLGFNTLKPPFDDIKVRRAIAHVVNKQAILDTVYFGQAEEANTIIPKSSWANPGDITTPEFSLEKAKRLLVEAGYPNGFTIDMWAMPVQRSYNPDALTMAKLIQADLKKIDVKVNVISYEWQEFLKRLAEGEHQTVLLGWAADHPDPDNFFSPLLSCISAATGSNRTFWCNKDYDSLISSAVETTNITKRKQYYKEALAIIADELPLVPIAHSKRYQARTTEVKGTLMSSFGGINFDQVSKQ